MVLLSSPFHHCLLNMSLIPSFPLMVLVFLLCSTFFSVQGCPPHELKIFLRFRSSLNDTMGTLSSWKGNDCCTWEGVKCSPIQEGRYVFKLDLRYFWLDSVSRQIDSSLSELKHLKYLDLSGNYFHGEIPSHLGKLSSLRYLDLSCYFDDILTSSNLHWLSNLSSLDYLSLSRVVVSDKSWARIIIGSLPNLQHLDLSLCFLPASTIPNTLLNLSSLVYLDLRGNSFSGTIPNNIGNLSSLEYLDLSSNSLTGEIPLSVGHIRRKHGSLSHLDLGWDSRMTGRLHLSFRKLFSLAYLDASNNHLSGTLPLSVANLSSLAYLNVSGNHLNGSIPSTLMLPSSLQELYLSNNNMNGTITEVFFHMSLKLEQLDLSNSGLSVNISTTWIPSFQLKTLLLKNCKIGGPIPSWISTQFRLEALDLSGTQLMGNLPSWLWDIFEVHLSDNHLQGSFTPTSGSLSYLDLSLNEFSGRLPVDIHMLLPNADVLILAGNKFEGQIPTSIANITYLTFLDVSNNSLTGKIPAILGNLTSLKGMHLQNNYLEGEIPRELGSLTNLWSLRIGKNSLQGFIPLSLRNLSSLQVFDVGENILTGNVPQWMANLSSLHVLVMRANNFGGILLPDIGQMPNLQVLDLSSNYFSGTIPPSYFTFPAMHNSSADGRHLLIFDGFGSYSDSIDIIVKGQERHYEYVLSNLVFFDLSNNKLSGLLAPDIENLKGLMYLNLSINSLNGPIPESLGNMVQLESLDLSFNNFSKQIPWTIGNLTYLAHLNLSYNNLSGRIPQQGGQMLTFDKSSYIGNSHLWGCPLPRNCSHPGAPPPPIMGVVKRDESLEIIWYWMCFGLAMGVGFAGVVIVLVFKLSWRKKCFEMMDRVIAAMDRVLIRMLPKPKHV